MQLYYIWCPNILRTAVIQFGVHADRPAPCRWHNLHEVDPDPDTASVIFNETHPQRVTVPGLGDTLTVKGIFWRQHTFGQSTSCSWNSNETLLRMTLSNSEFLAFRHTDSTYYIGMRRCPCKLNREINTCCKGRLLCVWLYIMETFPSSCWAVLYVLWFEMQDDIPRCSGFICALGDVMCCRMCSKAAWSILSDINLCV